MPGIARLFQAFLAPAIFISATALLVLSINVRLMGIVSRMRQYVHAKHDATKNDRAQEAEAYTEQISAIETRAEMIRRCFLLVLTSLAGTIASCLLLGLGPLLEGRRAAGSDCLCDRTAVFAGWHGGLHPRNYAVAVRYIKKPATRDSWTWARLRKSTGVGWSCESALDLPSRIIAGPGAAVYNHNDRAGVTQR